MSALQISRLQIIIPAVVCVYLLVLSAEFVIESLTIPNPSAISSLPSAGGGLNFFSPFASLFVCLSICVCNEYYCYISMSVCVLNNIYLFVSLSVCGVNTLAMFVCLFVRLSVLGVSSLALFVCIFVRGVNALLLFVRQFVCGVMTVCLFFSLY